MARKVSADYRVSAAATVAADEVVVDDADGLHQGIHRGRADVREADLLQRLAQREALGAGRRHLARVVRRGRPVGAERPEEVDEAALLAQRHGRPGVRDRGIDLASVADDARLEHQALGVAARRTPRSTSASKPANASRKAGALVQDRQPGQARLERLEGEPLEVRGLAVDRHPPLGVVVGEVDRIARAPRAARESVVSDHRSGHVAILAEPTDGGREGGGGGREEGGGGRGSRGGVGGEGSGGRERAGARAEGGGGFREQARG